MDQICNKCTLPKPLSNLQPYEQLQEINGVIYEDNINKHNN